MQSVGEWKTHHFSSTVFTMGLTSLLRGLALVCHLLLSGMPAANAQISTAQRIQDNQEVPTVSSAVAHTVWGILAYTRWPSSAADVQLCVAGETPHAGRLLPGAELPGGRKVQVRRIFSDQPQPLQGCDALYAGTLNAGQWQRLMASWSDGQALLTLSENATDCAMGGMFCLSITNQAVGFELNLDSMARSGVRVNPRVLGLVRRKEGN